MVSGLRRGIRNRYGGENRPQKERMIVNENTYYDVTAIINVCKGDNLQRLSITGVEGT